MKMFTFDAQFTFNGIVQVEAENEGEAFLKAEEGKWLDSAIFERIEFEIIDINPVFVHEV